MSSLELCKRFPCGVWTEVFLEFLFREIQELGGLLVVDEQTCLCMLTEYARTAHEQTWT